MTNETNNSSEPKQFPQEDRYCVDCKHVSRILRKIFDSPDTYVCRHENNTVTDIDPVEGVKTFLYKDCETARRNLNPASCGLEGRWYEEKIPVPSRGVSEEAPEQKTQSQSPLDKLRSKRQTYVLGDNL